jgi:type VI secretion system protein
VRNYRLILPLFLALLFSGCGVRRRTAAIVAPRKGFSVEIVVASGANQNNPVALDLVMVMDKNLLKQLAKTSAKDWFQQREQFQRDYPGKMEVVGWEWVPGQIAGPIKVQVPSKAVGAYLYANYFTPGDHRALVDLKTPISVSLREADLAVTQLK